MKAMRASEGKVVIKRKLNNKDSRNKKVLRNLSEFTPSEDQWRV